MDSKGLIAGGFLLALASCTTAPPPKPAAPAAKRAAVICPSCPSPAAVSAETARLREELHASVPQDTLIAPDRYPIWVALARQAIEKAHITLQRPQLLVVVDRNPRVQRLMLVVANPYGPWQAIGGSKVSTGESGVRGSFITPTGVFVHNGDILDYRALGTFNENHIRGLGLKGARVWDFGWQWTVRGWGPPGEMAEIRMLLHATDPDYLESLLGRPASQGCVRIPATMNRFLDSHGVLDRDYEELARYDPAYAAVLLPDRDPSILAGDKLVIIDSLAPLEPGTLTATRTAANEIITRGLGSGCRG